MEFKSEVRESPITGNTNILFQVGLEKTVMESITMGEFAGIGDRIADRLAEILLPQMEHKLLTDPQFSERLMNDVLIRIANRLSDKGLLPQEEKQEDGTRTD